MRNMLKYEQLHSLVLKQMKWFRDSELYSWVTGKANLDGAYGVFCNLGLYITAVVSFRFFYSFMPSDLYHWRIFPTSAALFFQAAISGKPKPPNSRLHLSSQDVRSPSSMETYSMHSQNLG